MVMGLNGVMVEPVALKRSPAAPNLGLLHHLTATNGGNDPYIFKGLLPVQSGSGNEASDANSAKMIHLAPCTSTLLGPSTSLLIAVRGDLPPRQEGPQCIITHRYGSEFKKSSMVCPSGDNVL